MLLTHEYYEELCALTASGQASEAELVELRTHLGSCEDCRSTLIGFAQVVSQAIPEIADKRAPLRLPSGMTERFAARARSEGIALTAIQCEASPWRFGAQKIAWSGAAAAVLLTSFWISETVRSRAHPDAQALRMASPFVASHDPTSSIKPTDGGEQENAALKEQLRALRAEKGLMVTQLLTDEVHLKSLERGRIEREARIAFLSESNTESGKRDQNRDVQLAQLRHELEELRSQTEADRIASLVQEAEVNGLRLKLATETSELEERHQLTATANQARDLIVARNLHIIDVHDADEEGQSQRAFGRIFYTEGKSLVFYAYDLADPRKLTAKISFYVWGEKLGATQRVKSLGIFRSDDQNDGRWVLTFDDANVLAQINSVFVTVERGRKTVTQPSGKKILLAYLGDRANHP